MGRTPHTATDPDEARAVVGVGPTAQDAVDLLGGPDAVRRIVEHNAALTLAQRRWLLVIVNAGMEAGRR